MAIIDENGMSFRLVEFCKENRTFKKSFVSLFTDKTDVKDIEFTGNKDTGCGMPDITISFFSGFVYYIEVKTRCGTGFQENQVSEKSGYAKLIKDKKQKLEDSLGYLLDNNHDHSECLAKNTIVRWQEIFNLVKDFNNQALVKDIIQSVDGIQTDEKFFGNDEEFFANPYQLALFNDNVIERKKNERSGSNVVFDFLVPALKELGYSDAKPCYSNDGDYFFYYVDFKYVDSKGKGKQFQLRLNYFEVWEESYKGEYLGKYLWNAFTFYRPWIIGVRKDGETQLIKQAAKAVKLWLIDYERNIANGKVKSYQNEKDSLAEFREKAELYGNPFVCSNAAYYLRDCTEIYDAFLIPALNSLKKISGVNIKIKNKNARVDIDGWEYRYIEILYNDVNLKFNICNFWNSKTDSYVENHSFIFYRPWIVGVHKAKSPKEMIEYTKQAFELWLDDLKEDGYL